MLLHCIMILNDRFKNACVAPRQSTIKWIKQDISLWHLRYLFLIISCHFKKISGLPGTLLSITDSKNKWQIKYIYSKSLNEITGLLLFMYLFIYSFFQKTTIKLSFLTRQCDNAEDLKRNRTQFLSLKNKIFKIFIIQQ